MDNKLFKGTILSLLLMTLMSCNPTEEIYINNPTQWKIVDYTVRSTDWFFNNATERHEATYDLKPLNTNFYDDGVVLAYILIGSGKDQIQTNLPYSEVMRDDYDPNYTYTNTYGYDYQLSSKTIQFHITSSDLAGASYLFNVVTFRVVMLY